MLGPQRLTSALGFAFGFGSCLVCLAPGCSSDERGNIGERDGGPPSDASSSGSGREGGERDGETPRDGAFGGNAGHDAGSETRDGETEDGTRAMAEDGAAAGGASGTDGGSGGSGTGGSGGGLDGGPGCVPGDDRCVLPGTVDDFATCDSAIPEIEGRSGNWYFYRGAGVGCTPGHCEGASVPPWGEACGAWVAGGSAGTTDRFAGMGVGLNSEGPLYDACQYTSIEVTYGSDQAVRMFAKWNDVGADGERASVVLPATTGVGVESISLSSFSGIECSALTELQFEPTAITAGFGIAVYNVRFRNAASADCIEGSTHCPAGGDREVCESGAWVRSACPSGSSCTDGRCIADSATPVERHGHLRVSGTRLVDEHGAPAQLKGVSTHWLNYEQDGYATSRPALLWMRDNWNLSLLRVAMGVNAEGGYLDTPAARANMLTQVETAIGNAVAAGVYVLVDWHSHAAETQRAEAIGFFSDISARFGHLPNLLLETYNEPLDISWPATLKPYHQAVVAAIRDNDPDTRPNVIVLGTPNWDQDVNAVIGDPVAGTNLMYTVHFYSCSHNAASGHLGIAQSALNAGVPIFVSEWGATDAAGGTGGTPVCATAADGWHDWMNANRISSAAWKLDDCDFEIESTGAADTSCLLAKDAPLDGGWSPAQLNGHADYVVEQLRQ